MIAVSTRQRQARLAVRHRLAVAERTDDVAAVCDSVVCLHSSDPATVYLSAMARMRTPSAAAVASALFEDRSVIRHHAMRRTLWVLTPAVARWAHAACTVKLAAAEWAKCAALVEESGVAADGAAWVAAAREETLAALHELGSATSRELGRHVPRLTAKLQLAVGKPYANTQGAHSRVLQNLGFDGAIVRGRQAGSWASSEYAWSAMDDWVPGGILGEDQAVAATGLLRAYLVAFGPATTADIIWWTGWTRRLAAQALDAVDAVDVALEGGATGWLLSEDLDEVADPGPWVALLPALDPTSMGWKERSWYLGAQAALDGPLFDRNGNCGPTIWMDGRVVGGWAQREDGSIATAFFEEIPARRRKEVTAAAKGLREAIGDVRFRVRFPARMQTDLLTASS